MALGDSKKGYIVYTDNLRPIEVNLAGATYNVRWINAKNGQLIGKNEKVNGGKAVQLKSPQSGEVVLWLTAI